LVDNGWGLWVLEWLDIGEFIGFIGLVLILLDVLFDFGVEYGCEYVVFGECFVFLFFGDEYDFFVGE